MWCVEMVPKRKQFGDAEKKEALWMAKGIPKDPDGTLLWMAGVFCGLEDHREPRFAEVRQRLAVFTDKKQAAARARKATNEFWKGKVRAVRVV